MRTLKYQAERLTLTTKDVLELESNYLAIPNNCYAEIYSALRAVSDLLQKYTKVVLVVPARIFYPREIVQGFIKYCQRHQQNYAIIESTDAEYPISGAAYFTLHDTDLVSLIKLGKTRGYIMGEDFGLLSLADSPIKRFMGITVISTGAATLDPHVSLYRQHPQLCKSTTNSGVIRRKSL